MHISRYDRFYGVYRAAMIKYDGVDPENPQAVRVSPAPTLAEKAEAAASTPAPVGPVRDIGPSNYDD